MINIKFPNINNAEQEYILSIVLGDFLGIQFKLEPYKGKLIELTCSASKAKLTLNTDFFIKSNHAWLKQESMPDLPLETWMPTLDGLSVDLLEDAVPVLYGQPGLVKNGNHWHLNVDVFGSAFFMLSRYEELICRERDQHDRFPASASIAYKAGFLDRPIVNEYLEILWACIHQIWPNLERKKREFRKLISCDVDHPIDPIGYSFKKTFLRVGARVVRDKNIPLAFLDGLNYLFKKFGSDRFDEYRNNIYWIMEVNEKAGNKVAFFFIPQQTCKNYEDMNIITSQKMVNLLKHIVEKGHEVGFHPGYGTYKFPDVFKASIDALKSVLLSIGESNYGGRQHYLRYDMALTPQLWENNSLDYDSSLGFADREGFRCGVCYEFTMFDLVNRKKMKVKQRPLLVMDCTIISNQYGGFGYTDKAGDRFKFIENICRKFNGDYVLLWHNSFFTECKSKLLYLRVIND